MANTTGKKFGGRKKGTPNKDTKQLRDKIEMLLTDQWHQIQKDLEDLKPKDRIDTYIKLLEYSLPKLNRQYLNTDPEDTTANIVRPPIQWTDEPEPRSELTANEIKRFDEYFEKKY